MALGSNLPDFDLIYTSVSGNKLDYLLEHRGYTHTLVGVLIMGALSYLACTLVLRRRGALVLDPIVLEARPAELQRRRHGAAIKKYNARHV